MLLDCVIYCAFYSILFRGAVFFRSRCSDTEPAQIILTVVKNQLTGNSGLSQLSHFYEICLFVRSTSFYSLLFFCEFQPFCFICYDYFKHYTLQCVLCCLQHARIQSAVTGQICQACYSAPKVTVNDESARQNTCNVE